MIINHLGPLNAGEIQLKPLTILTGANNQGKTYFSYFLYGILKNSQSLLRGLIDDNEFEELRANNKLFFRKSNFIVKLTNTISNNIHKRKDAILEEAFHQKPGTFKDTEVHISNEEFHELLRFVDIHSNTVHASGTSILLESTADGITLMIANKDTQAKLQADELRIIIEFTLYSSIDLNINTFYFPAERIGINVFRRQLNKNKIDMFDNMSKRLHLDNIANNDSVSNELLQLKSQISSAYPEPIEDYLNYINGITEYKINDTDNPLASYIRQHLIKGRFDVDPNTGESFYRSQSNEKIYEENKLPLHVTSSSIKSIYGLDYFFETIDYKKQNVLIIDEPEMNLHPTNQLAFAKLLDMIVESGIQTVISTHSDFLVRKIQNMMLHNKIYNREQGLTPANVGVYNFENGSVREIDLLDDNEAFNNFNDTVNEIEEEYLDLLEQLALKTSSEGADDH